MSENAKKNARNDLTQGVIWKKLLIFYFPILLGMLFQQLYSTVDAAIVGKFISSNALAAVGGSSSTIINTIIGMFTGLATGFTVIISQSFGAKDTEHMQRVLHTGIVFNVIIGAAITVLGYFLSPALLRWMGTPEDILEDSILYLRVYFTGSIPLLLYNLFHGTLQAVGNSRRTLFYLIATCVLNVILDYLFVAILGMGIAGAGWATVLSFTVCMIMALSHFMRDKGCLHVDIARLRMDHASLKETLRIGLPAGLQGTMYNLSNLIIQISVNSFGTTMVAAWTATGRLDGFYWVTINSFGVALCAFVGQCWGAGKLGRMRNAIRTSMKMAIGITLVFSAVLMLIARPAYSLFLNDQEVIDNAVMIMNWFVPYYFIWSFVEILSGTYRGTGNTLIPMIITMISTCLIRVLWMLLVVPRWHTMFCVSIIYIITWSITATAMTIYYFRRTWLRGRKLEDNQ